MDGFLCQRTNRCIHFRLINRAVTAAPLWVHFGLKPRDEGEPSDAIGKICRKKKCQSEALKQQNLTQHLQTHHPQQYAKNCFFMFIKTIQFFHWGVTGQYRMRIFKAHNAMIVEYLKKKKKKGNIIAIIFLRVRLSLLIAFALTCVSVRLAHSPFIALCKFSRQLCISWWLAAFVGPRLSWNTPTRTLHPDCFRTPSKVVIC